MLVNLHLELYLRRLSKFPNAVLAIHTKFVLMERRSIGQKQGCVDLFSHEGLPTLAEKSTQLSEEAAFINDVSNFLNTQSLRDLDSISKLPSDVKLALSDHNKRLISLLSHLIKDNREVLVGKQIALKKIKENGWFWLAQVKILICDQYPANF